MRIVALHSAVALGTLVLLITEALGAVDALRRTPVVIAWVLTVPFFVLLWRRVERPRFQFDIVVVACSAAVLAILCTTLVTALASAPNSADALAYHLPRVVFWMQAGNVEYFPTAYLNQIMLQPLAEYFMLHLHLLSGGDRFANLVQWFGFGGSLTAVSVLAREWGLPGRMQAAAALVCATLPNAVLQASGAKNELLLTMWLLAAVVFALRKDWIWMALACGLALATKGTAYVFLPALLLGARAWSWRPWVYAAAGALLLNGPQYARNIQFSGSALGFDSAHADAAFRWRNDTFGVRPTLSNLMRHLSEQLGTRSEQNNQRIYQAVVNAHSALGVDPQDPRTTWRWSRYQPPVNANHEANANNRWHLLLAIVSAIMLIRQPRWRWWSVGLIGAVLLFSAYLRWQPYSSRFLLPLFVASSPLIAAAMHHTRNRLITAVLLMFLLSGARLPATENWTRPLTGDRSVLNTPRWNHYFYDTAQWNNGPSYLESVRRVRELGCRRVGFDLNVNHVVYPLMALLPGAAFVNTGVANPSARYRHNNAPEPCAIVCLDCAGVESVLGRYPQHLQRETIGKFVLLH